MKSSLRLIIILCAALCTFAQSFAQSTPASIYAESFRQGQTRIVENRFEIKLTPQDSTYRERIKDSHGVDRYVFSVIPQGPEGDTEITSWQVKLVDLHHPFYDNVLQSSQQPSSDPKNVLWWLDPSKFAPIPIASRRIIKVDSFFITLQVKAFHFTPSDSPYVDSMAVAVEFTNTDPRVPDTVQK
jgi:hypothetical protein